MRECNYQEYTASLAADGENFDRMLRNVHPECCYFTL